MNKHTKEYERINTMLVSIEKGHQIFSLNWCADRVGWAWKWKKITKEEMEELADRITARYYNE